jgi:hypothetical protein
MHEKEVFIGEGDDRTKGRRVEETKDAYRRKSEAELKELNARLDLLDSKAQKAHAEAKIGYTERIYELKKRRDGLRDRIEELSRAGGDAWKDLRKGIEEAALDLRTALDVAATRFIK